MDTLNTTLQLGIDVSNINPPVNWQVVRSAQITYGFIKATEGATFIDKTFNTNWEGMKQAGIIRGAYHFFRPTTSTPQEQADNFLTIVKDVLEPGDLPPVLDVEAWPETVGQQWKTINLDQRIERVQIWLKKVEQATKRRPIIYTSPSFWKEYMGDTQNFTRYPLWIAHYTDKPEPLIPAHNWGGNGYTFWQYTEKGTVAGVSGNVDKNRFKGSIAQLMALVNDSVIA